MKNIRIRKIIPLVLITGVLTLSGCEREGAIQKNTLMIEEDTIQNEDSENITEEQAKEIAKKSFKKYFNEDVRVEELFEHTELLDIRDKNNERVRESWEVLWSTFDHNRLKNTGKLTKDEREELTKDYSDSKRYYIEIEAKTGGIENIYVEDSTGHQELSLEEIEDMQIEEDDLKKIALDYIKQNKLVDKVEDFEFIWDASTSQYGSVLIFTYDENKAIIIWVDYLSKKITGFTYQDEEFVKDAMRDAKYFKESDTIE